MTDKGFSPEKFIDREVERELFNDLLRFQDARLLTIYDMPGRGKSSLLRRFRYECGWFHDPPKLASLVSLDELPDPSSFALISEIKKQLIKFADEIDLELRFPRFDRLNEARLAYDFQTFFSLIDSRRRDTDSSSQTGSSEGWSAEKDVVARRECVKAFFEDLRRISDTQPVILLLDSWERAEPHLGEWIVNSIVQPLCFDTENRPEKFALVLAGRQVPAFKREMNEATYNRLVKSIESLGVWNEIHVKQFFQAYGFEELLEEDFSVKLIQDRVNKNDWSLTHALQLAEAIYVSKGAS